MHREGSKHGGRRRPPARARVDSMGGEMFFREGDYWTVAYGGILLRLRDAKGLRYVAQLLNQPGEAIAAVDLMAADAVQALPPTSPHSLSLDREHARIAVTKRIKETIRRITSDHPSLGYHLGAAIKTGMRCSYQPDSTNPVAWRLG